MFAEAIRSTPFTGSAADTLLSHIDGHGFENDVSFVASLRALVYPRLKKDDMIYLTFSSKHALSKRTISDHDWDRIMNNLASGISLYDRDLIQIVDIMGVQDDISDSFDFIEEYFEGFAHGWERLEKVTDFYRKQFRVLCYINPEIRSVIIYAAGLNVKKMHYLQCSILAFLPWYFNPDDGVTELEMELIESLRERSSAKYMEVLNKMASAYDFRSAKIKKYLEGFESQCQEQIATTIRNELGAIMREINNLNSEIANRMETKRMRELKLLGIETAIKDNKGDSELMDYFLCNNKLVLVDVNGTNIQFGVVDYLSYYDSDMAKSMIDNSSSYVYASCSERSSALTSDNMEKLARAIFVDETLRVRVCAGFSLNMNYGLSCIQNFAFNAYPEFQERIPNIHLDAYGCLGNYNTTINELFRDSNYIGVIEQCVASCKSINFGDSVVMDRFFRALNSRDMTYSHCNRCIELPDGKVVNPAEAVQWLEKQEEKKNEQTD